MISIVKPRLQRVADAVKSAISRLRPSRNLRPTAAPQPERYPWEDSYPASLDWRAPIETKPLTALLDDAAAAYPDNPCIEFLGKRYDYEAVASLADRVARGLQDQGIGKGDRVGLLLPNCPYYVIFFFGILKTGATVVNYNPLYAKREITRQIIDSETRIMVTLNLKTLYPKIASDLLGDVLDKIIVCRMRDVLPLPSMLLFAFLNRKEIAAIPTDAHHLPYELLIDNGGAPAPVRIQPDEDLAVLQYTGGTTGTPKGAMLTHSNLYANAVQTSLWAVTAKPGSERFFGILPLFHAFGMTGVMNTCLYYGGEMILQPRFNVTDVLKAIQDRKPTVFLGVPTMFSAINACGDVGKYDLSSLELCISGGAPLPLHIKTKFEDLSGCTLVEGYGLTEAGPVCTVNPFEGVNKEGSVGLPLPGTLFEITDRNDPGVILPLGEHGEICVTGPQVMTGYLNRPEENAATFHGGRLHTGDVGYIDADGYVYIIDRIKDLILNGGFNVYPRMVEEAIYLHPDVEETVVCGVPHRHRGEIVKAYVKLHPGAALTSGELRTFLKDKLATFEVPSRIEFRDELPRTLIGKPLRRVLIEEDTRDGPLQDAPESAEQVSAPA